MWFQEPYMLKQVNDLMSQINSKTFNSSCYCHVSWDTLYMTVNYKILEVLPFCAFNYNRDIKNFVQISILLSKFKIVEICYFSGNIESTKKADHILEILGLRVLSDY